MVGTHVAFCGDALRPQSGTNRRRRLSPGGGLKIPFRWTVAGPNGRFTNQIEPMQTVRIEDDKFPKPATVPPSS